MQGDVFFTYTCPVSRKTYAGHPRNGYLYAHENDIEEAVNIIHGLARKHGQPVTWVINDQEYTNQEGLAYYFKTFQSEGDTILVTMELTTSPSGVDKYDTKAVLEWVNARCKEAGLRIDGLWSLKFLESDLAAMQQLDSDEFAWTRNLAGSCWHQQGIDDSTWCGCPFNPYYASAHNVRMPAQDDEPADFLVLEWLSRDITAILKGGFPATFSLDPADTNRKDQGGFGNEPDALKYSISLIMELARQRALNPRTVINVNEEARHFQSEGHDKVMMLDGMFGCASQIENVKRVGYRDIYRIFRESQAPDDERMYVCRSVDWRAPEDLSVLYEDSHGQMGFLKSHGALPVEFYNYAARHPGNDSNDSYPQEDLTGVRVVSENVKKKSDGIDVQIQIESDRAFDDIGIVSWDVDAKDSVHLAAASANVKAVKAGLDGCVFIKARLIAGRNQLQMELA